VSVRPALVEAIESANAKRELASRRRLRSVEPLGSGRIRVDGETLLDVASNDYLGLAFDPSVRSAFADAAMRQAGARASHLLGGHHPAHERLEAELADWLGYPRVLLFSTGYMAALGAIGAVLGRHDLIVEDRLNHACLIDAARLSGARLLRYAHGDAAAAEAVLRAQPDRRALLCTDSVFSMDGDLAPLSELAQLAQRERALMMVDEAHAIGVLGPEGRGACAAAGLTDQQVPLLMLTFGKALGVAGAAIACSAALAEALLHGARSFVYTTAMPPAQASALAAALRCVRTGEALREQLADNVRRFRTGAARLGVPLLPSATAIQAIPIGADADTLALAEELFRRGVYAPAIRPPTVPAGQARIRISLSAVHTPADIDSLLRALADALGR
jgi:8-amino-7-oxononanoate synthase